MRKIDALVLGFFQDISDKCQSIFGFNNFALARFSIGVVASSLIMLLPISFQRTTNNSIGYIADIFIEMGTLRVLYFLYELIRTVEDGSTKNVFSLVVVQWGYYIRLYIIVIVILTMWYLWDARVKYLEVMSTENYWNYLYYKVSVLGVAFFVCYWYFIACTPKPPQKSKIKKLKERLAGWLQGTPALAPASIPR